MLILLTWPKRWCRFYISVTEPMKNHHVIFIVKIKKLFKHYFFTILTGNRITVTSSSMASTKKSVQKLNNWK